MVSSSSRFWRSASDASVRSSISSSSVARVLRSGMAGKKLGEVNLEQHGFQGEAGAKGEAEHRRSDLGRRQGLQQLAQHKQHRGRRHIAVVAQYLVGKAVVVGTHAQ